MEEIKVIKKEINYKSVNGDIKTYNYNQKKYNDNFFKKHKTQLLEKIICNTCKGSYNLTSKSRHLKTKKHLNSINNLP